MHVIGSITAKAAKPLPSELEAFVQSAGEHGVVFASLGTTAIPGAFQRLTSAIYATCNQHAYPVWFAA